jgi:LasA protease
LHFGRRYNGEWIPADCSDCAAGAPNAPMIMSGWTVRGYPGQEYQGYMENANGEIRRAEQGRDDPINEVIYSG